MCSLPTMRAPVAAGNPLTSTQSPKALHLTSAHTMVSMDLIKSNHNTLALTFLNDHWCCPPLVQLTQLKDGTNMPPTTAMSTAMVTTATMAMTKTIMTNQPSTTSTTNVCTMNHMELLDAVLPLDAPLIPAQPPTSTTTLMPMTMMMISMIAQPFHQHLQTLDNFHCNLWWMLHWSLKQFTLMLLMVLLRMTTTMLPRQQLQCCQWWHWCCCQWSLCLHCSSCLIRVIQTS